MHFTISFSPSRPSNAEDSDGEDDRPWTPYTKHPLFLQRLILVLVGAISGIVFLFGNASWYYRDWVSQTVWSLILHGFSVFLAFYDLYTFTAETVELWQKIVLAVLRHPPVSENRVGDTAPSSEPPSSRRHFPGSASELVAPWRPKRRVLIDDIVLAALHIANVVFLMAVMVTGSIWGFPSPVWLAYIVLLIVASAISAVIHIRCAHKERRAVDQSGRNRLRRSISNWTCACEHCAELKRLIRDPVKRGRSKKVPTRVVVKQVKKAGKQKSKHITPPVSSGTESDSDLEAGLLDSSGPSYGTVEEEVIEQPQSKTVKKKSKKAKGKEVLVDDSE